MWELAVADEARLDGVKRCLIKMMCEARMVDRVSTEVLHDKMGVVVKIEDDNSKPSAVVWSCHVCRHEFVNM